MLQKQCRMGRTFQVLSYTGTGNYGMINQVCLPQLHHDLQDVPSVTPWVSGLIRLCPVSHRFVDHPLP